MKQITSLNSLGTCSKQRRCCCPSQHATKLRFNLYNDARLQMSANFVHSKLMHADAMQVWLQTSALALHALAHSKVVQAQETT